MRVAFDSQVFVDQEYGGVSRYVYELALNLSTLPETEARIFAPLHRNGYLGNAPRSVRGVALKLPVVSRTKRLIVAMSRALAMPGIASFNPDIFHRTYYNVGGEPRTRGRKVLTVYDMIHERFESMFPSEQGLSAAKRSAVDTSDHIICISKQTQTDLVERFGVSPARTSVVYLGFDSRDAADVDRTAGKRLTGGRPYVLYVGSRSGYKNFDRFMRAFETSKLLSDGYAIVCFGGGSFSVEERTAFSGSVLAPDRIFHVGGDDARLREMYAGAALFAYPSLYEGFGIPPLEAMALDCPVVCGDSGSVPEVVGDAALQCNVSDVDAIRYSMETVVSNADMSSRLRSAGRERCKQFSWSKCAAETRGVYQSLL